MLSALLPIKIVALPVFFVPIVVCICQILDLETDRTLSACSDGFRRSCGLKTLTSRPEETLSAFQSFSGGTRLTPGGFSVPSGSASAEQKVSYCSQSEALLTRGNKVNAQL